MSYQLPYRMVKVFLAVVVGCFILLVLLPILLSLLLRKVLYREYFERYIRFRREKLNHLGDHWDALMSDYGFIAWYIYNRVWTAAYWAKETHNFLPFFVFLSFGPQWGFAALGGLFVDRVATASTALLILGTITFFVDLFYWFKSKQEYWLEQVPWALQKHKEAVSFRRKGRLSWLSFVIDGVSLALALAPIANKTAGTAAWGSLTTSFVVFLVDWVMITISGNL